MINRSVNIEPKTFRLVRHEDASGVSGTGVVAYGCMFADRTAVVRWCTKLASTGLYSDIDDVVDIHGHDGMTVLEWI